MRSTTKLIRKSNC